MKDILKYKGYKGSIEFSEEDDCFYGKVLDTKSLILYSGNDFDELEKNFKRMVEEFIKTCHR